MGCNYEGQNESVKTKAYLYDAYVLFNSGIVQLQNIVTGQLYSKVLFESLVTVDKVG